MLLSTFPILVIVSTLTSVSTQENKTDLENPKFLAIQHAQSGSISEINKTFTLTFTNESNEIIFLSDISRTLTLELSNISNKTILFSDRPDRIVTSIKTSNFIDNWSTGKDGYAVDPPNAVLIVGELEEKQDETLIELSNPVYEKDSNMLKYNIVFLNTTAPFDLINFGSPTLLIDFSMSQVTQAGDTISNLISQANSMKNNSVTRK